MIGLLIVIVVQLLGLALSFFLLGFKTGVSHWQNELLQVRAEAARASREMHSLTREAFIAIAEEAERRRR